MRVVHASALVPLAALVLLAPAADAATVPNPTLPPTCVDTGGAGACVYSDGTGAYACAGTDIWFSLCVFPTRYVNDRLQRVMEDVQEGDVGGVSGEGDAVTVCAGGTRSGVCVQPIVVANWAVWYVPHTVDQVRLIIEYFVPASRTVTLVLEDAQEGDVGGVSGEGEGLTACVGGDRAGVCVQPYPVANGAVASVLSYAAWLPAVAEERARYYGDYYGSFAIGTACGAYGQLLHDRDPVGVLPCGAPSG